MGSWSCRLLKWWVSLDFIFFYLNKKHWRHLKMKFFFFLLSSLCWELVKAPRPGTAFSWWCFDGKAAEISWPWQSCAAAQPPGQFLHEVTHSASLHFLLPSLGEAALPFTSSLTFLWCCWHGWCQVCSDGEGGTRDAAAGGVWDHLGCRGLQSVYSMFFVSRPESIQLNSKSV